MSVVDAARRGTTRPRVRAWLSLFAAAVGVARLVGLVHTYSRPWIRMDGFGYYAPLASVVCDRDLDLANELAPAGSFLRNTWFRGSDRRLVDPYPVGAAFLWAPAIAVVWRFDPARARRTADSWRNMS